MEETIENPDELIEVANKKEPNKPIGRLVNLIKDGVKLGYRLAQKNITEKELDDKTFKLISPRFLSVVPDNDTDSMNFISPSLLSLHDEGTGLENLTSLPTLMQEFTGRDQQEWLNFIVEAAGIDDQAKVSFIYSAFIFIIFKKLDAETVEIRRIKHIENYEKEVRNPETGQPLYFTVNLSRPLTTHVHLLETERDWYVWKPWEAEDWDFWTPDCFIHAGTNERIEFNWISYLSTPPFFILISMEYAVNIVCVSWQITAVTLDTVYAWNSRLSIQNYKAISVAAD